MAQLIETRITGQLTGATREGMLTPVSLNFLLTQQDAHSQQTVVVEPGDVLKVVALPASPGGSGTAQTFLMIRSDQDVQVRLNGVADLAFSVSKNGPFVLPGLPEVTQLEFTSVVAVDAKVFITKVSGTQSLPAPSGGGGGTPLGGMRLENIGSATIGQTAFVLPSTPSNPAAALLLIEGVGYTSPTFFTLSGTSLTWLDVPFTLPAGARVEILYQ